MQEEIQLKASVYDALKALAEKLGGVGEHKWYRELREDEVPEESDEWADTSCPVCINGMAVTAGLLEGASLSRSAPDMPLNAVGITTAKNDGAVYDLIKRGLYTTDAHGIKRVSWDDYVRALNIVRVEEDAEPGTGDHA